MLYCMVCFSVLCDWCVFVRVFFHVFVGVVRDVLCGDVWLGFVCVVFVCVCSLFKKCVACDGSCDVFFFVCVFFMCVSFSMFACVQCVCVFRL